MTPSPPLNRRHLAKGMMWAAPAIVVSSTVPAYAASQLSKTTSRQFYRTVARKSASGRCNVTTNPTRGYIDSLPYKSPAGNSNSDRVVGSSNGYWVEGSAGIVQGVSITTTITFNHAIQIEPTGSYGSNVIPAGWILTQTNSRTITMTYTAAQWRVSTSQIGSGDATGFFIQFKVTDGCVSVGNLSVSLQTSMTYTDANGRATLYNNANPVYI